MIELHVLFLSHVLLIALFFPSFPSLGICQRIQGGRESVDDDSALLFSCAATASPLFSMHSEISKYIGLPDDKRDGCWHLVLDDENHLSPKYYVDIVEISR